MTPTEHVKGRLWLLLPGCRPIQATALPAGIDPATATHHGHDGQEWRPGPPSGVKEGPAKAARRPKAGGTMFEPAKGADA